MNFQTTIDCPDCGSNIVIDSALLLAGKQFTCTNPACGTSVQLSAKDHHTVFNAIDEFNRLKNDAVSGANSEAEQLGF